MKCSKAGQAVSIPVVDIYRCQLENTCSVHELGGMGDRSFLEEYENDLGRWRTPTDTQAKLRAFESIKKEINDAAGAGQCKMLIACTIPSQTFANKALKRLGFNKTKPTLGSHDHKVNPVTLWYRPCGKVD